MIEITFKQNGFIVEGHAVGAGETGNNVVCAAVSAISTMTANGLAEWAELPEGAVNSVVNDGFLALMIDADTESTPEASALIDSFLSAVIEIADDNPEYVKIYNDNGVILENDLL